MAEISNLLAADPAIPIAGRVALASGVFGSSTGNRHRYDAQASADRANLANITDPTQRAAEQNFLDQYSGSNGFNRGRGYIDLPSVRKGRISYDTIKEQSLQNYYKDALKKNASNNYNNFNVEDYVRGETGAARRNMAQNVMNSQRTIQGNANSSGMLFSGRRQMGEAMVGQQANQDFQKYQQDLVSGALQKKQQLAADAAAPIQAANSADLAKQLQAAQMAAANSQSQGQEAGAGLGLIGQGVGNYYGSSRNQTPLSAPQLKQPTLG